MSYFLNCLLSLSSSSRSNGAKEAEVSSYQGHNGLLEGKKVNVINAEGADLFFVVARNKMHSEVCGFI